MEENIFEEEQVVETVCDKFERELAEEKEKNMYLRADFENAKKRLTQQLEQERKFKNKDLIIKLLDVIDNCERSFEYNDNESLVYKQLMDILKAEGVEKMAVEIGDHFDVNSMEAISITSGNDDLAHDTVSCVVKNGYTYKGEIIRFASVMVEKKKLNL